MSSTFNRSLNLGVARRQTARFAEEERLNVTVVFTSVDATLRALVRAGALAESLGAKITLVVPQIVPYPLPLTTPPVLLDFQERRFREIAAASPVEIRVEIYLCRDHLETLTKALKPKSLVVLGACNRWWPTPERRIARRLRRDGHEVIFAEL